MYPNNIYIKNYAEVKKYHGDMGVQLDKFDNATTSSMTRSRALSTSTGAHSRPACLNFSALRISVCWGFDYADGSYLHHYHRCCRNLSALLWRRSPASVIREQRKNRSG